MAMSSLGGVVNRKRSRETCDEPNATTRVVVVPNKKLRRRPHSEQVMGLLPDVVEATSETEALAVMAKYNRCYRIAPEILLQSRRQQSKLKRERCDNENGCAISNESSKLKLIGRPISPTRETTVNDLDILDGVDIQDVNRERHEISREPFHFQSSQELDITKRKIFRRMVEFYKGTNYIDQMILPIVEARHALSMRVINFTVTTYASSFKANNNSITWQIPQSKENSPMFTSTLAEPSLNVTTALYKEQVTVKRRQQQQSAANENEFNLSDSYDRQLREFKKPEFDPSRRGNRILFPFQKEITDEDGNKTICPKLYWFHTTTGQLNFFQWVINTLPHA